MPIEFRMMNTAHIAWVLRQLCRHQTFASRPTVMTIKKVSTGTGNLEKMREVFLVRDLKNFTQKSGNFRLIRETNQKIFYMSDYKNISFCA